MVRVVLYTFIFRITSLLSREVVFLAIFMKNMGEPLGVKMLTQDYYIALVSFLHLPPTNNFKLGKCLLQNLYTLNLQIYKVFAIILKLQRF